jgi:hypothetical protein
VFFDNDLSTQLKANKVTRTAIDRYTIVLMAGIAAEALTVIFSFFFDADGDRRHHSFHGGHGCRGPDGEHLI